LNILIILCFFRLYEYQYETFRGHLRWLF
jgi:hypothetical protein